MNIEKATPIKLTGTQKIKAWYIDNPVLVYTMGKVGSSSIVSTLRDLSIKELQPHSLSYSRKGSYFVIPDLTIAERLLWSYKSVILKTKIAAYKLTKINKKIKIISLTRDPVARNISAFFEQVNHLTKTPITQINTSALIEMFWKYANHETPNVWFDNELRDVFQIDIFEHNFNKEEGNTIIRQGNVEVLLLTLEKINNNQNTIAQYLGLKEFNLKSTNRAEKKEYKDKYIDFMKNIKIPRSYIDKLYLSKHLSHFYTNEQIDVFYKKWADKII